MLEKTTMPVESLDGCGQIPGPMENAEAFAARVEALGYFFSHPPDTIDHFLTDRDWEGAIRRIHLLYDAKPDWIVAHYSNRDLTFFQGGATWIVQKGNLRIPLIQLRNSFDSGSHLKLYTREEVLAHEAVHAIRMQFDEPQFEEIFAYKTSRSLFRRFLGPLFQKPWEANLFVLSLFLPVLTQVYSWFFPHQSSVIWLGLIPLFYLSWLFSRLVFLHLVLFCAIRKIRNFLRDPEKAWAAALRMTDKEIFQFAFLTSEKLCKCAKGDKTLRWGFLKRKFFGKIHH